MQHRLTHEIHRRRFFVATLLPISTDREGGGEFTERDYERRGGCTHIMHGRSVDTVDPRIRTNGKEHVGFASTRQTLLAPIRQTLLAPSAKHR